MRSDGPAKGITILVVAAIVGLFGLLFAGLVQFFGLVGGVAFLGLVVLVVLIAVVAGLLLEAAFVVLAYAVGVTRSTVLHLRQRLRR